MLSTALQAAARFRGFCAPNPCVGAVVVNQEKIVGIGAHQGVGTDHAEVVAIKQAGTKAEGASLYVTLEPCNHHGKTPPCIQAIIGAGIKHVIYSFQDPNPAVAGDGAAALAAAGIRCEYFPTAEISVFYRSYQHWCLTGRPWVTAKLAISLDGKIAGKHGQRMMITGEAFQRYTHEQRKYSDVLLTTARTIANDDPQFNVRLEDETFQKPVYIIDPNLTLTQSYQIDKTAKQVIALHRADVSPQKIAAYQALGRECIAISNEENTLQFEQIFAIIGQRGAHDVWVEVGGRCLQGLLTQLALQRLLLAIAPKVIGVEALSAFNEPFDFVTQAKSINWFSVGSDVVCDCLFQE